MKPSLCRDVIYQTHDSATHPELKSEPRAAKIIGIPETTVPLPGEGPVNLWVFNIMGGFYLSDVPYDPEGKQGSWRWPPRVQP